MGFEIPKAILKEFDTIEDEKRRDEAVKDYIRAVEQIDREGITLFGKQTKILLFADRLLGGATGLEEFLRNIADVTVKRVNNLEDTKKVILAERLDFLIFVGLQEDCNNYEAVELYRQLNQFGNVVTYATLSSPILRESQRHNIQILYDRWEPLQGFVKVLRTAYETTEIQVKQELFDDAKLEIKKLQPRKQKDFWSWWE